MKAKIVSIVGLTSSGKSSLGIQIAKMFNGEIVSCDSRQVYKHLDLTSGKVTQEEQSQVKHHLLDVMQLGGKYMDVFAFQQLAYDAIDDILSRKKLPILVGGTGLYSRAVVEGYGFKEKSNPRYDVLQIALMPSKVVLAPLVKNRIDQRLAAGMLDETRKILETVDEAWLSVLGLECYWNTQRVQNRITDEVYRDRLFTKTMQYAKRQRTWFKKEKNTHFLTDMDTFLEKTSSLVQEFL